MSVRSYTKAWFHLTWGTHNREKLIAGKDLRKELSNFYYEYSKKKNIYMKANFVNSDHVHALIDLRTDMTIEGALHLLKGASSNWLNKKVNYKFAWGKGYAAFSVSESIINKVVKYIQNQEEHHRYKTFSEEYEEFLVKHNIKETVFWYVSRTLPPNG